MKKVKIGEDICRIYQNIQIMPLDILDIFILDIRSPGGENYPVVVSRTMDMLLYLYVISMGIKLPIIYTNLWP